MLAWWPRSVVKERDQPRTAQCCTAATKRDESEVFAESQQKHKSHKYEQGRYHSNTGSPAVFLCLLSIFAAILRLLRVVTDQNLRGLRRNARVMSRIPRTIPASLVLAFSRSVSSVKSVAIIIAFVLALCYIDRVVRSLTIRRRS